MIFHIYEKMLIARYIGFFCFYQSLLLVLLIKRTLSLDLISKDFLLILVRARHARSSGDEALLDVCIGSEGLEVLIN